MKIFDLQTALLLCIMLTFSLLFVSVTLMCSNISTGPTQTERFRVVDRTEPSCISSTYYADDTPSFCNGFQNGKFEMTSNVTTVFLKIKQVNLSDTGMYFCKITVTPNLFQSPDGDANLWILIYGSVFFVLAVIGLVLKIGQLYTGTVNVQYNLRSNDLNSAVLRTLPKAMRNRRPALEREVETCVIHTASR
uniref:Immunoglobulin V-set domain-containing protein n=1 Tax=Amphiprion ocellaris TaxID=80972 RepID=A0A3Q1AU46_AMPOC